MYTRHTKLVSFEQPSQASLEEDHLSTLNPRRGQSHLDVLRLSLSLWGIQGHSTVPPMTTGNGKTVGDARYCLQIQHSQPP